MELAKHIELAPRNGDFVVLLDGCADAWEVGRWSPESNHWVRIDGKPVRIFPTHWVAVSGDAAGSDNSEGLSFLVPRPAPLQTAPKRHRPTVLLMVAATAIFLGGCAAYGFGLIGSRAVPHAGETTGSATAMSREASGARGGANMIAAHEGIAAGPDAAESKQAADARQSELKQALDEKEALTRELASVRGQLAVARDGIALRTRRETAVEARGSRRMPDARQKDLKLALAETKPKAEALAREDHATVGSRGALQAEPPSQAVSRSNAPGRRADGAAASHPRPPPPEPGQSPPVNAESSSETARLVARADWLIKQSDFTGARLLLEHALERGSARAAFLMAETYDWRRLRAMQAYGVRGDPDKARELYELAAVAGIEQARERLETLKVGLAALSRAVCRK